MFGLRKNTEKHLATDYTDKHRFKRRNTDYLGADFADSADYKKENWIPAFARMTKKVKHR